MKRNYFYVILEIYKKDILENENQHGKIYAETSEYIANLSLDLFYYVYLISKFIVYTASSEKIIMNELGIYVTTTPQLQ